MLIISHRGYLNGPNEAEENNPEHIENNIFKIFQHDFDVEIDLWKINEKLFLGHDTPKHEINSQFLKKYNDRLWIHCKNEKALIYMNSINNSFLPDEYSKMNYFWHENDKFTVTSLGHIWNHYQNDKDEELFWANSVHLLFNKDQIIKDNIYMYAASNAYGICTDYPIELKNNLRLW